MTRYSHTVLFIAFTLTLLSHAQANPLPLWSDHMPGPVTDQPKQIDTKAEKNNRWVTHTSNPTLTLYLLENETPSPLVIVCPGGGYRFLSIDKEGIEIAEWLNQIGLSAAVLTYRTPHNREGALLDANQAISICRQQAREWNINPEQIGMIGFSAGAHLTAAAAQNTPRQNFSILVYPAYLNQADSTRLTTDIAITKETPPAFITQAQDDKRYYRSALAYSLALEQANIPFELHFYTRGGHGYGLRDLGKPAHQWTTPCEAWLREQQILPAE